MWTLFLLFTCISQVTAQGYTYDDAVASITGSYDDVAASIASSYASIKPYDPRPTILITIGSSRSFAFLVSCCSWNFFIVLGWLVILCFIVTWVRWRNSSPVVVYDRSANRAPTNPPAATFSTAPITQSQATLVQYPSTTSFKHPDDSLSWKQNHHDQSTTEMTRHTATRYAATTPKANTTTTVPPFYGDNTEEVAAVVYPHDVYSTKSGYTTNPFCEPPKGYIPPDSRRKADFTPKLPSTSSSKSSYF
jgi:hypothetical protein